MGFSMGKLGEEEVGGFQYGVHMAAALIGCRTTLVGTVWTISHLV